RGDRRGLGAALALERGVDPDVDVPLQRAADRASLAGRLRGLLEALLVYAVDLSAHRDVRRAHALAWLEVDHRRGLEPLGRVAALGELVREGHAVARRVSGGEQLLGAGLALAAARPRRPRD